MSDYNAIGVGSGINSLVAGALLAKAGWRICLLERNDYFGGAIHTAEITRPGYHHELYSSWWPLFVGGGAYQELKPDLDARGVTFLNTPLASGTLFADGTSAFLSQGADAIIAELERIQPGDGEAYSQFLAEFMPNLDLIFGVLGSALYTQQGAQLLQTAEERLGRDGLLRLSGEMLGTARDWLAQTFRSPISQGLISPWIAHFGLGPEDALSGMAARVMAISLQLLGVPVPRGGGSRVVDALLEIIENNGGECLTHSDVTRVLVEDGQARGVMLAGGETITADRAVICNVTPNQLYQRLLAPAEVPRELKKAVMRFRPGLADMQIHLALKEQPRWEGDRRLGQAPIVNISGGLDAGSKARNESVRGLLPEEPDICVGQPTVLDPTRAPEGGSIIWIQLLGLPGHPWGDAAGKIRCGGVWTEDVAERFADRVMHRLHQYIPDLPAATLDRVVISPRDLEINNINHLDGDPYGGALQIAQHYLWRPMPGYPRHATHIAGLYHIGASTYPGHGLGGGSGLLVAKELLR
ncbi:MAG TPA: NAD(P)/FAD-dependent oxidoreductase [Symbiobacteriaceae bacterium]|nr:NAD(P)/FAD-dependent oxidoreductase [Symbiobacteriaceae bacterium]